MPIVPLFWSASGVWLGTGRYDVFMALSPLGEGYDVFQAVSALGV